MQRFKGLLSNDYELVPACVPDYYELENSLADRIAKKYRAPRILDIGMGTGITTAAILDRNPDCYIVGVDSEDAMIAKAKSNLRANLAAETVEIHCDDALIFMRQLPERSVDVVASAFTLHNCSSIYRSKVYKETFRLLAAGGMFINIDKYAVDDQREFLRELADQIIRYDALREQGREDLRRAWILHEIEDQVPGRIMWTGTSLGIMEKTGFSDVTVVERRGQYAIVTAYRDRSLEKKRK